MNNLYIDENQLQPEEETEKHGVLLEPQEIPLTIDYTSTKEPLSLLDVSATIQVVNDNNAEELSDYLQMEALKRQNYALKFKVADLNGELKASRIEIDNLRHRYMMLQQAVEQQDQVIAEIYAVTTPRLKALENYCKLREVTSEVIGSPSISSSKPSQKSEKHVKAEAMLQNHLHMMGFNSSHVNSVLNNLIDDSTETTLSKQSSEAMINAALDKLLYPEKDNYVVVEGNQDGDKNLEDSFEVRRKHRRGSTSKLSVSDFGLLCIPNDKKCNGSDTSISNESNSEDMSTGSGEVCYTPPTALFAGIDLHTSEKKHKKEMENISESLSYADFLERLRLPASTDILRAIRRFIGSILGPREDGRAPKSSDFSEYQFRGNQNLRNRCVQFFQSMDSVLRAHPAWSFASDDTLCKAMDGIEKYVMDKISDIAMFQTVEASQWKEEDRRLLHRMKLLSFITPDMLDVNPAVRNEVVWSIAEDELRRINAYKSPGDKINCIVKSCSVIFSALNLSRGSGAQKPGADDFLPIFIYIVLHSQIPNLLSNCEYISAYRNQRDLMSKSGYCLVNLRSAIEFISVLNASMLTVDPLEFERQLKLNESKFFEED